MCAASDVMRVLCSCVRRIRVLLACLVDGSAEERHGGRRNFFSQPGAR